MTNVIPMNDRIKREYMTTASKEEAEESRPKHWTDFVIDFLVITLLVMILVFALRLIAGIKQDKQEVAAYESHREAIIGESMETYGELHTDGTSTASMVYSDGYRAFYETEEVPYENSQALYRKR